MRLSPYVPAHDASHLPAAAVLMAPRHRSSPRLGRAVGGLTPQGGAFVIIMYRRQADLRMSPV
jgi:hypothetical protein